MMVDLKYIVKFRIIECSRKLASLAIIIIHKRQVKEGIVVLQFIVISSILTSSETNLEEELCFSFQTTSLPPVLSCRVLYVQECTLKLLDLHISKQGNTTNLNNSFFIETEKNFIKFKLSSCGCLQ